MGELFKLVGDFIAILFTSYDGGLATTGAIQLLITGILSVPLLSIPLMTGLTVLLVKWIKKLRRAV